MTFDRVTNTILRVPAADKNAGRKNKIHITNDEGCFSKDNIDQIVKEAENDGVEGEVNKDRIAARSTAEICTFSGMQMVGNPTGRLHFSQEDKRKVLEKCQELLNCLECNQS